MSVRSEVTPNPVRFCKCVATRLLRTNVHNNICPRCTGRIPHELDESLVFNDTISLQRPPSSSITPPPEQTPPGFEQDQTQRTFQYVHEDGDTEPPNREKQQNSNYPEADGEFEDFINRYRHRSEQDHKSNIGAPRPIISSPLRGDHSPHVQGNAETMNVPGNIHPTRGLNELQIKIPLFSGNPEEDIESLILNFNTYCNNTGKNDQYKAAHIPLLLKGEAHAVFRSLPQGDKENYEEICKQLRLNFGVVQMPGEVAYPLLTKLKMTTTVQEYLNQFRKLCTNLDVTPAMTQAFFIDGLTQKVKQYVTIRQPKSLNEAIQYAKQGEAIAPEPENTATKAAILQLTEEVGKITSLLGTTQMRAANMNVAPREDTCQICSTVGHIATQCPRGVAHRKVPWKDRVCYYCRQPGHKIADCELMFEHQAHDATEYGSPHFGPRVLDEPLSQPEIPRIAVLRNPIRRSLENKSLQVPLCHDMTVIASMEGVKARFLVDTGSNVEVISEKFARKMIPKPIMRPSLNSSLKMVDGSSSIVLGTVVIPIILGNHSYSTEFQVIRLDDYDGVLGRRFLEKRRGVIDMTTNTLSLKALDNEQVIPLPLGRDILRTGRNTRTDPILHHIDNRFINPEASIRLPEGSHKQQTKMESYPNRAMQKEERLEKKLDESKNILRIMEKESQATEGKLKKMDSKLRAALTKLEKKEAAVENLTREVDRTATICKEQESRLERLKNTDNENKTLREQLQSIKSDMSKTETELRTEQNNLAMSKDRPLSVISG